MRKEKRDTEGRTTSSWLTTYADLVILLLTFFVLLMSMSIRDQDRIRKALGSVAGTFGSLPVNRPASGSLAGGSVSGLGRRAAPAARLDFETLKAINSQSSLGPEATTLDEKGRVVVVLNQKVLFGESSVELDPNVRNYLAVLSGHLRQSGDGIEIRGYSDIYESIDNPYWPGNSWELSTRRAQAVYNILRENGVDVKHMSARGYGDSYPMVDSAANPDLRYQNARVEIAVGPNVVVPSRAPEKGLKRSLYFDDMSYKNFLFKIPSIFGKEDDKRQAPGEVSGDGRRP
jgi:chemotaxis protein MotB